jgi:hypothetical protein
MGNLARTAFFGFALFLATGPASAAGTVSLDDVQHAETESLDDVDDGETHSLDAVPAALTDSLDSVDDGRMVPASEVSSGETHPLDSEPRGTMHSLDSAEDGEAWSAPACDEVSVELPRSLPASDRRGWSERLSAAKQALAASKARLDAANAAYSRSITRDEPRGQGRADIIATRDAARAEYSAARCQLPALVENAREAGVEADLIRGYR